MVEYPNSIWVGATVSWFLLTSPIFGGEDREHLVAMARDGNRAAIQSITSMACQYERVPWYTTSPEQANKHFHLFSPGKFWRTGDTYRLLKPVGNVVDDYLVRNGQGLFLRKGGPLSRPILSSETLRPVDGIGGEMWQWLLFSHWGRIPVSYYPFHEILAQDHVIQTAERLPPPANVIHVELTHSNGRLGFWFDPKVNYLIRKSVMVPAGDTSFRWENEVIEFSELAPAVFVPTSIEHRCSINGNLQAVIRTRLSVIKVNQPLPPNALRLPGIEGMDCIDLNRDVKFKVDADGNRVGSENPVHVARITGTPKTGGSLASVDPTSIREASQPPTPLWLWILLISMIVLAMAAILALRRHRKRALQA